MAGGTDYPDWTAPQAHASAIAATGAPLLTLPGLLASGTLVVGAGLSTSTALLSIDQPSYELRLNVFESGTGAASPLAIKAQWFDPAGVTVIDQETWSVWPGLASGDHVICGKGPTRGLPLQITFTNVSAAMQYSVTYAVYARSHVYDHDDWRSLFQATTASGGTLASADPPSNAIANRLVSVAAAGTDFTELPLFSGRAFLYARTGSNTSDLIVTLDNSANTTVWPSFATIGRWKTDVNGNLNTDLVLPRGQCRVRLNNTNAGAQTCVYSLVEADY